MDHHSKEQQLEEEENGGDHVTNFTEIDQNHLGGGGGAVGGDDFDQVAELVKLSPRRAHVNDSTAAS